MATPAVDNQCINAIRALVMDAVEQAQSGHAGMPLGAAPAAYVLWTRFLKHQPEKPTWWDRDRFILSAGHGSMLLYTLLHLSGYGLTIEDLKSFRQLGSRTPGHPEYGVTPGVEATTGPLGQGLSMAVGMAMAEKFMSQTFNKPDFEVFNHHTYVLCGDGDLMEGVASEAASLAGHLHLGKLIVLYDSNGVCQDGSTAATFTENVGMRFTSYGWQYLRVSDGNNLDSIEAAILAAQADLSRPTLIEVCTVIGYGSPLKQGTNDAHSGPLGSTEVSAAKAAYGWDHPPFSVPDEVYAHFSELRQTWRECEENWQETLLEYQSAYPREFQNLQQCMTRQFPVDWDDVNPGLQADVSGRDAFSAVMQRLAADIPTLIGGSADLASSNRSWLHGQDVFSASTYTGRNICYGVREHAMAAIASGMALHGGIAPFVGTFLVFSDYMKPAIRLASLMSLPVIYTFTHDSLFVGEDGPTHQPVEQLTALRSTPGLFVFRPADATEVFHCIRYAVLRDGPSAIVTSRQSLPYSKEVAENQTSIERGGYIVLNCNKDPDIILMASGSELHIGLGVAEKLAYRGLHVRVVSMPCMELFASQEEEYRNFVLPPWIHTRLAIEMADPMPWYRYVGLRGTVVGVNRFGQSGKGSAVAERYGFTVDHAEEIAWKLLGGSKHD